MPLQHEVNRSYLETLYDQLDSQKQDNPDAPLGNTSVPTSLQYTGFAIMCKDLIEYLAARGDQNPAVDTFRSAYNTALNTDAVYLCEFHPKAYAGLNGTGLPSGLTERIAMENLSVPELQDPNLVTQLSPLIGWIIFREYSKALGPKVLEYYGEAGVPSVYDDRKVGAVNLAVNLFSKSVIPNEYYWYAVTIYLCILLYKTDFKTMPDKKASNTMIL